MVDKLLDLGEWELSCEGDDCCTDGYEFRLSPKDKDNRLEGDINFSHSYSCKYKLDDMKTDDEHIGVLHLSNIIKRTYDFETASEENEIIDDFSVKYKVNIEDYYDEPYGEMVPSVYEWDCCYYSWNIVFEFCPYYYLCTGIKKPNVMHLGMNEDNFTIRELLDKKIKFFDYLWEDTTYGANKTSNREQLQQQAKTIDEKVIMNLSFANYPYYIIPLYKDIDDKVQFKYSRVTDHSIDILDTVTYERGIDVDKCNDILANNLWRQHYSCILCVKKNLEYSVDIVEKLIAKGFSINMNITHAITDILNQYIYNVLDHSIDDYHVLINISQYKRRYEIIEKEERKKLIQENPDKVSKTEDWSAAHDWDTDNIKDWA